VGLKLKMKKPTAECSIHCANVAVNKHVLVR